MIKIVRSVKFDDDRYCDRLAFANRIRGISNKPSSGDEPAAIEAAIVVAGLCDGGRLEVLIDLLDAAPPEVFWPVWLQNWSTVDGSALYHELLPALFQQKGSAAPYYDEEQRSSLDALPNKIIVYRGCDAAFTNGISWTVYRTKAEFFAAGWRLCAPRNPVLLTATINKNDPHLFYVVGECRGEGEIVCLPKIVTSEPRDLRHRSGVGGEISLSALLYSSSSE